MANSDDNSNSNSNSSKKLTFLVVESSKLSLYEFTKILVKEYNYIGKQCSRLQRAYDLVRRGIYKFDVILCDAIAAVHCLDLVELIGLKHDVVLIIVLSDDVTMNNVIKGGVKGGACFYCSAPATAEEVGVIPFLVSEKQRAREESGRNNDGGKKKSGICNGGDDSAGSNSCAPPRKKRFVWGDKNHAKFVGVLEQMKKNNEKIGPKRILELMGDPSISREQIASHLQKYRHHMNKIEQEDSGGLPRNPNGHVVPHPTVQNSSVTAVGGVDPTSSSSAGNLQTGTNAAQLMAVHPQQQQQQQHHQGTSWNVQTVRQQIQPLDQTAADQAVGMLLREFEQAVRSQNQPLDQMGRPFDQTVGQSIRPFRQMGRPHIQPSDQTGGTSVQQFDQMIGQSIRPFRQMGRPQIQPLDQTGETWVQHFDQTVEQSIRPFRQMGRPHIQPSDQMGRTSVQQFDQMVGQSIRPFRQMGRPYIQPSDQMGRTSVQPFDQTVGHSIRPFGQMGWPQVRMLDEMMMELLLVIQSINQHQWTSTEELNGIFRFSNYFRLLEQHIRTIINYYCGYERSQNFSNNEHRSESNMTRNDNDDEPPNHTNI